MLDETQMKPVALFDLDGTLCDFAAGMKAVMGPLEGPGESWDYDNYDQDNELDYMKARRRLAKNQPGFWRNLPVHVPGMRLLLDAVNVGFQIVIFTKAPRKQLSAFTEKAEWCEKHLAQAHCITDYEISIVTDKGLHYGKLLVDDWPPYVERWLEHRPRGQVIMPAHKYNRDFKHPQVYRCEDPMDPEVMRILKAVHAREIDTGSALAQPNPNHEKFREEWQAANPDKVKR